MGGLFRPNCMMIFNCAGATVQKVSLIAKHQQLVLAEKLQLLVFNYNEFCIDSLWPDH